MLATISIVVSIVVGLPGIILFFRQRKTKLVYLENKQINIQDDLLKNFDDVSIKYKGQEIDSNLIFIKGYIICDGSNDITSNGNYITISSPENTKWVDFKIISKSKELSGSSNFQLNEARINFDLFKSRENFEFEGIIERAIEGKEKNITLSFFHRIPNLSKTVVLKSSSLKDLYIPFVMATMFLLWGLFLFWTVLKINYYDLSVHDSNTNTKITNYDISQAIQSSNIIEELRHETNGVYLMFTPSKDYSVSYDNYDSTIGEKTIVENTIFFKKDLSIGSIIAVFIAIILLLFSTLIYCVFFLFLSQKKYLKYIA